MTSAYENCRAGEGTLKQNSGRNKRTPAARDGSAWNREPPATYVWHIMAPLSWKRYRPRRYRYRCSSQLSAHVSDAYLCCMLRLCSSLCPIPLFYWPVPFVRVRVCCSDVVGPSVLVVFARAPSAVTSTCHSEHGSATRHVRTAHSHIPLS
jgi:hypothetical protein